MFHLYSQKKTLCHLKQHCCRPIWKIFKKSDPQKNLTPYFSLELTLKYKSKIINYFAHEVMNRNNGLLKNRRLFKSALNLMYKGDYESHFLHLGRNFKTTSIVVNRILNSQDALPCFIDNWDFRIQYLTFFLFLTLWLQFV